MMIDPVAELAHTDEEIAELEQRLEWLQEYRALCHSLLRAGVEQVPFADWRDCVAALKVESE
ncbi:hypothetical protein [Pseudoclavibacter sp. 13-3]|uniref:hypothetical protein n=1 Tax=Pseudoclavibacter sp. 13-3 TaxID=2901228 RepID=UPI001E4B8E1B|nr:hypothetical protein [Pseudoclavibacter sp. 13-3]MCD7101876.1 hypothetical protein [Pseudoclavibacter sp. 13-3]